MAERLGLSLDVVEFRPTQIREIAAIRSRLPVGKIYFEVPSGTDPAEYVAAIADAGGYAKIRTGGVTQHAIPSVHEVAHFLSYCVTRHVPFKATAGLHHALRGIHPLTYAPDSERALMYGFINVILATSMLSLGGDIGVASALLEDSLPTSFSFDGECARWRDQRFAMYELVHVRENIMMGFGSCSFTEPLDEMKQLRWL
ncbi:hypothetical protein [Granulicella arctica]|uniref:Uncharacterized protein n=1 Tax=Granulicella arctica TaxID=940613 RepID=A0A7Y9PJ33_9BACT|nr:hypothetical protein [Granulicella arctica]NYF80061.1 hypothetical protein [Granulicella arctica]